MANGIAFAENFTGILDAVYQRSSVSRCLNSGYRVVQASRHAKEIKIPKVSVAGLGGYVRNQGYKTGTITMSYKAKLPNYDRGIRLMANVMDIEEGGVLDVFVMFGVELQRTWVAPEVDAFTLAQMASREGVPDEYNSMMANPLAEMPSVPREW